MQVYDVSRDASLLWTWTRVRPATPTPSKQRTSILLSLLSSGWAVAIPER